MAPTPGEEVDTVSAGDLTLDDLDFELPRELVAQHPVEPRDAARLLVVPRYDDDHGVTRAVGGSGGLDDIPQVAADGGLRDARFRDLPVLLRRGDVLVRNDTRVFPARAFFRRATGGRIEVLFLERSASAGGDERWEALVRGRPRPGETLRAERAPDWSLRCVEALGDGRWVLADEGPRPVLARLTDVGETPLPPYIRARLADGGRYQTTYARTVGSAAAPTAGLHFTPAVDAALTTAGVAIETITLHIGLGTFRPLHERRLDDNRLHAERFVVDGAAWRRIAAARAAGRRVVAVGTTTVRTLEHLALAAARGEIDPDAPAIVGETDLFIVPGFRFRVVDGLLTNFHLPRSSLLALVMAFAGIATTRAAYRHAVALGYRFYSFGDAMLVLP
ncbi:MAG TPA: tRNA preQ1(34) S-adenosylmethionine ribosyltransferase-isomerase QueA [Thermoleophilia bacterium]|nr:tRNA preQ1(34) S-adenosylmethionine ribosyltransferase-isomerase QueA [Thermoleophilia bacterium]